MKPDSYYKEKGGRYIRLELHDELQDASKVMYNALESLSKTRMSKYEDIATFSKRIRQVASDSIKQYREVTT